MLLNLLLLNFCSLYTSLNIRLYQCIYITVINAVSIYKAVRRIIYRWVHVAHHSRTHLTLNRRRNHHVRGWLVGWNHSHIILWGTHLHVGEREFLMIEFVKSWLLNGGVDWLRSLRSSRSVRSRVTELGGVIVSGGWVTTEVAGRVGVSGGCCRTVEVIELCWVVRVRRRVEESMFGARRNRWVISVVNRWNWKRSSLIWVETQRGRC